MQIMYFTYVGVALEALERCVKVDEKKAEFNYSYIHANSE